MAALLVETDLPEMAVVLAEQARTPWIDFAVLAEIVVVVDAAGHVVLAQHVELVGVAETLLKANVIAA